MVNPRILHQKVAKVSRTPVISIIVWKWSIHYTSLSAMLKPLHSKQIKNCTKNTSSHYKKYEYSRVPQLQVPHPLIIIWKVKYPLHFFVNSLHANMNQDLVEKYLCDQGNHYEKYGLFPLCMQRKPSYATTCIKSAHFDVSKDKWNTKEDTTKYALCILRYAKMYISGWSDIEQWKKQSS